MNIFGIPRVQTTIAEIVRQYPMIPRWRDRVKCKFGVHRWFMEDVHVCVFCGKSVQCQPN